MATVSDYDLIVIGAGSGGLIAARYGAKLGARVALVERDRIGGDCTWTGCVPSKALIRAAHWVHGATRAHDLGMIAAPAGPVDIAAVRRFVQRAIERVYQHETPQRLQDEGIDVLTGEARFVGRRRIAVGDRTLDAEHIVIATGASPHVPAAIAGIDDVDYWTYEHAVTLPRLPKALVVIGGGPIGVEMAQSFARLGAAVTVVARRVLPRDDPDAAAVVVRALEADGVRFALGPAQAVSEVDGTLVVETKTGSERGDALLVATGRRARIAGLCLDEAGIETNPRGIVVDKFLRTTVDGVYAVGDCIGGPQFTHYAGWQGFQAVRNALLPGRATAVLDHVPATTFTDPEVGTVGMTEAAARSAGIDDVRVTRVPLGLVDRAVCDAAEDGFIQVVHRAGGKLLGASCVAPAAGELIGELSLALGHGMSVGDIAAAIHPYPTYGFGLMQLDAQVAFDDFVGSTAGRVIRRLSGLTT